MNFTDEQREVLVKVHGAPTPHIAHTEMQNGAYASEASKVLIKYGILDVTEDEAHVTELGMQKMADENLVDASGVLTDYGNSLRDDSTGDTPLSEPAPEDNLDETVQLNLMQEILFRSK
jgi:hypothetical protein